MHARSLIVPIAWLATIGGCAATPPQAPAASAEATQPEAADVEIRLQAGQEIEVDGADLRISIAGVDSDSRCAKGETCVWEGSAAVRLAITGASGTQQLTLHTSPRTGPMLPSTTAGPSGSSRSNRFRSSAA